MRKVIIAICGALFIIIAALAGLTIQGRTVRQTELENAMTSAMEKTMQMLEAADEIAPQTDDEMIAYFIEALSVQIESQSKLTVNILEADVKKGLLSAEAILTYMHPIGRAGAVSCQKTIILEQFSSASVVDSYVVKFIVNGDIFKIYTLKEGSPYIDPGETPEIEGKTFSGWTSTLGTGDFATLVSGKVVEGHIDFVACYE